MTIQVSVLIWTVICFCVLMLILNRLLFKPLLAFMDERSARIRRAKEKKALREKTLADREAQREAEKEQARLAADAQAKAVLEAAEQAAQAAVAAAEEQRLCRVQDETAALERENLIMNEKLSGIADDLARSFAERLTIGL